MWKRYAPDKTSPKAFTNRRGDVGIKWTLAAIASAVVVSACGTFHMTASGGRSTPLTPRMTGLTVTGPDAVRAVWTLPWPYPPSAPRTSVVGGGGAGPATIVMRSPSHWMWVGLPGGPLWREGTGRGPQTLATTITATAVVNSTRVMGSMQTGSGNSNLVAIHASTVHRASWPVPVPRVQGLNAGASSGIASAPSGNIWIVGGTVVQPAIPATAYHDPGLLAPLFHPILAEVTSSGHVMRQVVLSHLVVGGVSGLTRAPDGSLWFGINTGRYEVGPQIYRGPAELVHWSPSTGRMAVYPVPRTWGHEALLGQILTEGSTVWASLQYSPDGSNSGRTTFLLRFNTSSHGWSAYPVQGGSIDTWTLTPTGTVVSVVHAGGSLAIAHHIVARVQPGYVVVGVVAQGPRMYLVVSGHHRIQLVAISAK